MGFLSWWPSEPEEPPVSQITVSEDSGGVGQLLVAGLSWLLFHDGREIGQTYTALFIAGVVQVRYCPPSLTTRLQSVETFITIEVG